MPREVGSVVVVGAGPAGAVAAHVLATKGRPVVLVDQPSKAPDRVEMLPPAAVSAFAAAGLAHILEVPTVATRCLGIVRGGHAQDREDFIARPGGRGLAVDRKRLDAALRKAAIDAGAELRPGRLVAVDSGNEGIAIVVAGPRGIERLDAAAVVDATGRTAAVSRRLGAELTTWQRLTARRVLGSEPTGPWLSFSTESGGWSYAITGPEARVDAWRVSTAPSRSSNAPHVDASARMLTPAAGAFWIAIGDASIAFDPICCQGLAHAAKSALVAAGVILQGGTVRSEAAEIYDAACRETAIRTEEARRAVYASITVGRHVPTSARQTLDARAADRP